MASRCTRAGFPATPPRTGACACRRRLPNSCFEATENGVAVVVADDSSHGPRVVSPGVRAPVDAYTGIELYDLPEIATVSIGGGQQGSIASNAME